MRAEKAIDSKDLLGECPLWDERTQALVGRYSRARGEARGGLIAALQSGLYLVENQTLRFLCEAEKPADHRFNDGRCDRAGRFWVGTLKDPEFTPSGSLYCFSPEGGSRAWRRGISVPNSLAWSPDGRTMYFADSPRHKIWAFDYDAEAGVLSNERLFAAPHPGFPDRRQNRSRDRAAGERAHLLLLRRRAARHALHHLGERRRLVGPAAGVNGTAGSAFQRLMRIPFAFAVVAAVAGCGATSPHLQNPQALGSVAVVPSPYEPAAQFNGSNANYADGAIVGGIGGAGIGALSAQASGGLLCTVGGPLCLIVVIPAAIVGGLVGGVAGAAVDAITTDPGGRIAVARGAIEQAVADMRLTEALAAKTAAQSNLPLGKTSELMLEVGVSDLQILAREKEMALLLRARSRLYRAADGEVIEERVSEAQTGFRKYQDWAADEARPLQRAVDTALADLSRSLVSARLETQPRANTSARRGG